MYVERLNEKTLSPEAFASLNGIALRDVNIELLLSFKIGGNDTNLNDIYTIDTYFYKIDAR